MESVPPRTLVTEQPSVFSDLSTFEELKFLSKEPKRGKKPPTKLNVSLRTIVENEKNRTGEFSADTLKTAVRTAVLKGSAAH